MTSPEFTYFIMKRVGDDHGVGGMAAADMLPAEAPSMWLTWFAASDCDATAARVRELGGAVTMPPTDSPFGRMALVSGRQGEMFGVIDLATTAGDAPAPN